MCCNCTPVFRCGFFISHSRYIGRLHGLNQRQQLLCATGFCVRLPPSHCYLFSLCWGVTAVCFNGVNIGLLRIRTNLCCLWIERQSLSFKVLSCASHTVLVVCGKTERHSDCRKETMHGRGSEFTAFARSPPPPPPHPQPTGFSLMIENKQAKVTWSQVGSAGEMGQNLDALLL